MEALVNNLIKATGWSIFHSLWQGALLYALLILLFTMVPKHNARLKHNLAYMMMTLMFAGFCATFYTLFTWPPLQSATQSLSLHKVVSPSASTQAEKYFPMLASIYAIGLLLQFGMLTAGYYKTWKIREADKTAVPEAWAALFNRISRNMGIRRNAEFYLSSQVTVPMVVGFFKPMVLFPMAFATQLDMVHLEAILIHELSHIRRNDYFFNILKTVMETILFFNPFAWLCSNHIQREREHACDDMVLKQTHTPLTYAHALLQIELLKEKHTPVFSMAASGDNQHLYQRIKRITDMKTNYNTTKQQLFAVGITLVTLMSIAWVSPSKPEPLSTKKNEVITKVETQVCTDVDIKLQDSTKNKKVKKYGKAPAAPTPPPPMVSKSHKTLATPPAPPAPPALKSRKAPVAPPTPPQPMVSPEEMARVSENVRKHFESAEWKNHQAEIEKNAFEINERVNSAEFKKQMAEMKKHSAEMARQFNSPEWKKQMAEIKKQSIEMARQFNSPEFRKKMEGINEVYNGEEFKALELQFRKDVEALKQKKTQQAEEKH